MWFIINKHLPQQLTEEEEVYICLYPFTTFFIPVFTEWGCRLNTILILFLVKKKKKTEHLL